jgi:hypothetical protein
VNKNKYKYIYIYILFLYIFEFEYLTQGEVHKRIQIQTRDSNEKKINQIKKGKNRCLGRLPHSSPPPLSPYAAQVFSACAAQLRSAAPTCGTRSSALTRALFTTPSLPRGSHMSAVNPVRVTLAPASSYVPQTHRAHAPFAHGSPRTYSGRLETRAHLSVFHAHARFLCHWSMGRLCQLRSQQTRRAWRHARTPRALLTHLPLLRPYREYEPGSPLSPYPPILATTVVAERKSHAPPREKKGGTVGALPRILVAGGIQALAKPFVCWTALTTTGGRINWKGASWSPGNFSPTDQHFRHSQLVARWKLRSLPTGNTPSHVLLFAWHRVGGC